ncbi:MAG: hypothetical protein KKH01_07205 [Firmicutes bacterium]|nr:hypothetical protein [Bacillota bacterium]
MLLKLIKHELISSYRKYLPIYAVVIIMSILSPATYRSSLLSLYGLASSALMLIIGAMGVYTIYNLILSLGLRVYGNPGYLLFSLPVKTRDIMISKAIVNAIWIICSGAFGLLAFSIFLNRFIGIDALDLIRELFSVLFQNDVMFGIIYIVFGFVYIFYIIAFLMFILALLNLIYKGEHKILTGIILYFVMSTVISFISVTIFGSLFGVTSTGLIQSYDMLWVMLYYLIITITLFLVTHYMMDKKLDLQ